MNNIKLVNRMNDLVENVGAERVVSAILDVLDSQEVEEILCMLESEFSVSGMAAK